ncbi:M1 family aminopeptidase [Planctomycetota bacterium]
MKLRPNGVRRRRTTCRLSHVAPIVAVAASLALLALTSAISQGGEPPPRRYPRDRALDVTRISLDLNIDIEGRSIGGTAHLDARCLIPPLKTVSLDAVELWVSSVRDGDGRQLRFWTTGDRLEVELAEPIRRQGDRLALAIAYRANPVRGLHFFAPSEEEPDTPLQVWSQNESLDARYWFPCIDTPEERQATEISVTVPEGFQVVSNGTLISAEPDQQGNGVRWHHRQELEHPAYLVSIVVGRFHVEHDVWDGVPLSYYVPPDRADDLARTFAGTKAMLSFFSRRLGVRYPFEKYDQVVVEQFIFGGMENTGATTLNERTLHDQRAHLDYSSDGLIAHELAHQWFGDLVTCRDWGHIWLNEGFASFMEACWDEHKNGREAYLVNMLGKAAGALSGGRRTPLVRRRYRRAPDTFGGGTYPKGAFVLHMLRYELGEEQFWKGIGRYLERFRGRPVETEDFRRVLEEVTGRSLGRFFYEWTERPGHPVLDARVRWLDKAHLLEVKVKQTQGGEPFHATLQVAVQPRAGERLSVPVHLAEGEARLLLPLTARPRYVTLDGELRVLKEITLHMDRDLLTGVLRAAPSIVERIDAVRTLARDRSGPALTALGRTLMENTAAGVRVEAARVLGGMPGEKARDLLLSGLRALAAGGETEPNTSTSATARDRAIVRRALVDAVASRRGDVEVEAALLEVIPNEPSYAVTEAAARILGSMQGSESLLVLLGLLETDSHNERVRRAAIAALSKRRELAGLERTLALARTPTRWEVRQAAIQALGTFGTRGDLDPAQRQELVDLLRDTLAAGSPRIRREAAQSVRAIGASAAGTIETLAALAKHDPNEAVRRAAEEATRAVRKGKPADRQLEELRRELRGVLTRERLLRERLERLEARSGDGKAHDGPW